MNDYTKQICEACSIDAPEVSEEETSIFLKENEGWELSDDVKFRQLKKIFKFHNFLKAQEFSIKLGQLAEKEGHHPTILLEYGKVTVRWWSHKIKSLHKNDLILSAKTDLIRKEID